MCSLLPVNSIGTILKSVLCVHVGVCVYGSMCNCVVHQEIYTYIFSNSKFIMIIIHSILIDLFLVIVWLSTSVMGSYV